MKRFISFALTLVLLLSFGVTAMADDTPDAGGDPDNTEPVNPDTGNTTPAAGTISISNPSIGNTYAVYKIFDASYAVDEDGNVKKDEFGNDIIAYGIAGNSPFFEVLFGTNGVGHDVFVCTPTHIKDGVQYYSVVRKALATKDAIVGTLRGIIQAENAAYTPAAKPIEAESTDPVVFSGLPFGYYLIDKGIGAAVTITNNTPYAEVIDKAQKPGTHFNKWVFDKDENKWDTDAYTYIGDMVEYKVQFTATNYDGEHQIKHYIVKDEKGSAQWAEFKTISVTVQEYTVDEKGDIVPGEEYFSKSNKGYYHFAGGRENAAADTHEWEFVGDKWSGEKDDADWYLIHRGYDAFDIVIPWMTEHDFEGTTNDYTLTYDENSKSKYPSDVLVTVKYQAVVEPNATIGNAHEGTNLFNTAALNWTSNITGSAGHKTTKLETDALALRKIDADTEEHLAGAEFTLWSNAGCTDPVYIIPTDIEGVYILDDLNATVSGDERETAREKYDDYLEEYLGNAAQKNEVVTPVNGKVVVLGLKAGTYYLKEEQAPGGYNKMDVITTVSVGAENDAFFIIADKSTGEVFDQQNADGTKEKIYYPVTVVTVKNDKGVALPSTGGEGTMMLITIGTVIALAFAVLLITHKKMSVYND